MLKRQLFVLCLFGLFLTEKTMAGGEEAELKGEQLKEAVLSNPESVKLGEKRFNALCAYCHGSAGSGGKARKLQGRELKVDYVFNTITNGKKRGSLNMPPWRNLSEEVRWQLTAYILSLGKIKE